LPVFYRNKKASGANAVAATQQFKTKGQTLQINKVFSPTLYEKCPNACIKGMDSISPASRRI